MGDGRAALRGALFVGFALAAACSKREPAREERPAATTTASAHSLQGPWADLTPDRAFVRARAEGKLVFLYWGAAWCPPCNDLKSEVFSKPRFAEMMRDFVPVHLDGDTEDAQRVGEALSVSSYPTILVLSPEREELLRLNGSIDIDELDRALGAVRGKAQSFRAAAARLDEGKPSAEDCSTLAHAAWELLPEETWSPTRILAALRKAIEVCPSTMNRERALLAGTLLGLASSYRRDPTLAEAIRVASASAPSYLDLIFSNAETTWAARALVNHRAEALAAWLAADPKDAAYLAWKTKWLAAAASLRSREGASVDVRLAAVAPSIDFFRHENPAGPVPDPLRADVLAAVTRADHEAKTPDERYSVVSTASYLLRRVGAHDEARKMLKAEAERSGTPHYWYSMLSAVEKELGRIEEARAYSQKAREGAGGRATRLQWITNDILFHAALEGPPPRAYLLAQAEAFYELAFSLPDGFQGRNRTRAEQVKAALAALKDDPEFAKLVMRLRDRCSSLPANGAERCRDCLPR
ncbi:thioredoxin family protein [Polyangium jinanense]|uniref:Thioredoxin family protein n=1 Tax=Polyangium jinanense TaxID=2829994 RepID=A0A9X3X6E1_9BACT|nr:thioredoxin family protein [Polyangium jinanense]MDC3957447.1 thioredoxin family protein [Polyangium jinanense]MDC3985062.1 thioredoxin family protein [Polyangium jinanense]